MNFSYDDTMSLDRSSIIVHANRVSAGICIEVKHHFFSNNALGVESHKKLISKFTYNGLFHRFVDIVRNIVILLINFELCFAGLFYSFWLFIVTSDRLVHFALWSFWKSIMFWSLSFLISCDKGFLRKSLFRFDLILKSQRGKVYLFGLDFFVDHWDFFLLDELHLLSQVSQLKMYVFDSIDKVNLFLFRSVLQNSFAQKLFVLEVDLLFKGFDVWFLDFFHLELLLC